MAKMVSHLMVQHIMCHSNLLCCAQGHDMLHVHGMGRGGWWAYTHVVIGVHSHHWTVISSTALHSACIQVHNGPLGGAPHRPYGMANPLRDTWCWLGTTLQCLLVASGRPGPQSPYDGGDLCCVSRCSPF